MLCVVDVDDYPVLRVRMCRVCPSVCVCVGQVHTDVDGDPVLGVRLARHRAAAGPTVRAGHSAHRRHVGTRRLRLNLLPLPRRLLPLHLLRRE